MMIMLVSSVCGAIDLGKFDELKGKDVDQMSAQEKDELKKIALEIIDNEMSKRIEALGKDLDESGIRTLLNFKKKLIDRDIQYKDAPKTWKLIKEKLPGETTLNAERLLYVTPIPEDGTTHYLGIEEDMRFEAIVQKLGQVEGEYEKDITFCWEDEGQQKAENANFRLFHKPKEGIYELKLKVLRGRKDICVGESIANFTWTIQVGGVVIPQAKVVRYLPEERNIQLFTDESQEFKVIVDNENRDVKYDWSFNGEGISEISNSYLMDKCDQKDGCTVTVSVSGVINPTTETWEISNVGESVWKIFRSYPDHELVIKPEEGNQIAFTADIDDGFWDYYEVVGEYQWDFDGDLRFDRKTSTGKTTFDYSVLPEKVYEVTVKVPVIIREDEISSIKSPEKDPIYFKPHFATAVGQVKAGYEPEEETFILKKEEDTSQKVISVSGVVYEGAGVSKPLEGVKLVAKRDGSVIRDATTNAEGVYKLENIVSDQKITITLSKTGYKTSEEEITTPSEDSLRNFHIEKGEAAPEPTQDGCPHATESCIDGNGKVHLANANHRIQNIREVNGKSPIWITYKSVPSALGNVEINGKKYRFEVTGKCFELVKTGADYYFKDLPAGIPASAKRARVRSGDTIHLTKCSAVSKLSSVMKEVVTAAPQGDPKIKELQNLLKEWKPEVKDSGILDSKTKELIEEALTFYSTKPSGDQAKEILDRGVTKDNIVQNFEAVKTVVEGYVAFNSIP